MSNATTAVAVKPKPQTQITVVSCLDSPKWKEEIAKVIPKEIALEAMVRVARSVASDSKFMAVEPKSFLLALLKCGRAGLYPDGREAHLIAFGRDVQAIFDVKGITALAGRAGILVTPKLVHEHDEFMVEEDDGTGKTKITHRVDYRKPRGEVQAVYSRAVMPSGQVDYEVMTADEVESVRQQYSRAKDSSPWIKSWGEMAKKTAIKRHSKRWDMSPEIRQALNLDDDSAAPFGEPKLAAPIFQSAPQAALEQQPAAMIGSKSQPQPLTSAQANDPVATVRRLCKQDGISEEQMVKFLITVGLADDGHETLDDVPLDQLPVVIDQWDEMSAKAKEVA